MRQISLLSISLHHFKAFTGTTVFTPSRAPGLKLIGGVNEAEPSLGANGVGKSSLWDGLAWCLHGSTLDDDKGSAVATLGKGSAQVVTRFLVDDTEHEISRASGPERMALNGKPCSQNEIDQLLGATRAQFRQAVLFGQRAQFFYDMPIPARGEFLDHLLDLSYWVDAADKASSHAAQLTGQVHQFDQSIARLEGTRAGMKDVADLQKFSQAWIEQRMADTEQALDAFAVLDREHLAQCASVGRLRAQIADLEKQGTTSSDLRHLQIEMSQNDQATGGKRALIGTLQKELTFYQSNQTCPTCRQPLASHVVVDRRRTCEDELKQLRADIDVLARAYATLDTRHSALKALHDAHTKKLGGVAGEAAAAQQKEIELARQMAAIEKRLEGIAAAVNPFTAEIEKHAAALAGINASLSKAVTQRGQVRTALEYAEFWKAGFKRVRLFLVKRLLGFLSVEVQAAARALGLIDWQIEFLTETETKSGTLKSGVQIVITRGQDGGRQLTWSGGEEQRIRLAVGLGVAQLVQRMTGVAFDFEVWDEPTAHLSPEGVEGLLDNLAQRAATQMKAVWLIDHSALTYAGFSEIWQVRKTVSGSGISLISTVE